MTSAIREVMSISSFLFFVLTEISLSKTASMFSFPDDTPPGSGMEALTGQPALLIIHCPALLRKAGAQARQ
jgi:hypothetical protein